MSQDRVDSQDRIEGSTGSSLNDLLVLAGLQPLDAGKIAKFDEYLALILRWNARMNLTAVRDSEGILSRHFVESIACAQYLPGGIESLLDFGTGAGFPGIPIAICQPTIQATLAESQGKKAAFLQEAIRVLGLKVLVFAGRAEHLTQQFDCVTLRAVDQMEQAVKAATILVKTGGWLTIMTTQSEIDMIQTSAGPEFEWQESHPLLGSEKRVVAFARKLSPKEA